MRLFDELAAGFNPIVSGVAGKGEFVAAFGEEVSPETDLLVRWFDRGLGSGRCWLLGGRFFWRRRLFLFLGGRDGGPQFLFRLRSV